MRNSLSPAAALACVGVLLAAAACNVAQTPAVSGADAGVAPSHIVATTGNKPAEIFNQILPYPAPCQYGSGPCPTDFEVVFKGDVTKDIPPNEPLNVHEDAFCNPSQSQYCSPTVTYNPSSNTTTIEWSGPTLFHNRTSGQPGVHFGLMAGQDYKTKVKQFEASSEWTYASTPAQPQPIVSIAGKEPVKSANWKYAIVYVAASTKQGAAQYATWSAVPYVASGSQQQPRFTFSNYGSQTLYVSSSGIVINVPVPSDPECLKTPACPENQAILAALQEVNYPPPGSSSSPFVKMQYPPPAVLKPRK